MPSVQIFISYAKEDYDMALKLYNELKKHKNLNPWLDAKSILPGQKWKPTISEAIRKSRFFIALLSSNSVDKKGYVQKELKEALDIFQEYPEKAIYLIPARLDDCKVPHTDGKRGILTKYHIKWTTIKGRQQSKRCYKVLIGRLQLGYMLC